MGTVALMSLFGFASPALAGDPVTWNFVGVTDTFQGSVGNERSFTIDGYELQVRAYSTTSPSATLSPAFVTQIDGASASPPNSAPGGIGVWSSSEPAIPTGAPHHAQLDSRDGHEFLIFAFPSEGWELPDGIRAFDTNETYDSSNPAGNAWPKWDNVGRTDVTWWIGGTLADGGTEDDPFQNFAGKTIAQITAGWTTGESTGNAGDGSVSTHGGTGRYLIIAPEWANNFPTSNTPFDAFFVEHLKALSGGCETPPTLICGDDQVLPTDPDVCHAAGDVGYPDATDECTDGGELDVSGTRDDDGSLGDPYALGETQIDWTATDSYDNEASCVQYVEVYDAQAPTIECPPDAILVSDADSCSASEGELGDAYAADNCEGAEWTNDAAFPYGVGENVVTYSAIDAAGNPSDASCGQRVTVVSAATVGFLPPLAGQPVANQINAGSQRVPVKIRLLDCAGLPILGGVKVVLSVDGIQTAADGASYVAEAIEEDPNGRGEIVDGEALMQADGDSGIYHFNIDTTNWQHTDTIADPSFHYLATVSVYDAATLVLLGSDSIKLETRTARK